MGNADASKFQITGPCFKVFRLSEFGISEISTDFGSDLELGGPARSFSEIVTNYGSFAPRSDDVRAPNDPTTLYIYRQ